MSSPITSAEVWRAIDHQLFAVLGMATAHNEARTVGVVYVVHDHHLFVGTDKASWKVRHIAANPQISMTIPIAKRIPFLPWIKIPAATVTFSATARVLAPSEAPAAVMHALFRGMAGVEELMRDACVIDVAPHGEFVTYGVGVTLLEMRDRAKARGRAPVDPEGIGAGASRPRPEVPAPVHMRVHRSAMSTHRELYRVYRHRADDDR